MHASFLNGHAGCHRRHPRHHFAVPCCWTFRYLSVFAALKHALTNILVHNISLFTYLALHLGLIPGKRLDRPKFIPSVWRFYTHPIGRRGYVFVFNVLLLGYSYAMTLDEILLFLWPYLKGIK